VFDPWDAFWEAHFGWELGPVDGGLSPTTDRAAILEDIEEAARDFTVLWPNLTMPTLLIWAARPINGGLIVPEPVRDALLAEVPGAQVHPVERNHYTVMTEPGARQAVVAHVTRS
jgi:pimeloyl-ACP methyl ester carboxylesterase